jgi:trehalose 6-phosphate synthase
MMTRGFTRKGLAGLYRTSAVCLVTPLRDGMNLVAKEFVAAQDPADPGVLVLSRFAGAAHELREALIVNPHDSAEVADALQQALQMPLGERQERWRALNDKVQNGSAARWCETFLDALEGGGNGCAWRAADQPETDNRKDGRLAPSLPGASAPGDAARLGVE